MEVRYKGFWTLVDLTLVISPKLRMAIYSFDHFKFLLFNSGQERLQLSSLQSDP